MEEQYKGHVLRVTTKKDNSAFPWKPICRILNGTSGEFIKQIDWELGYDTPDRAKKAGLIISKNGLTHGSVISKPVSLDSWQPTPSVMTMEANKCPMFVDGKKCGRELTRVDLEAEKIARYDLATYQCSLGHRSYILLEPK